MKNTNTNSPSFDQFVCVGDTIEIERDGFVFTATIEHDQDAQIDDDDCHNVDQSVTGCDDGQQERLLAARASWFADGWFYCCISVNASRKGIDLGAVASLCSIEANYPGSDNAYLTEVALALVAEGMGTARAALDELRELVA